VNPPDEFREASKEPVTCALRITVQVRPSALWVGVNRLDGSPHPGGTHLWSRRYDRPEGKTEAECVEAGLRMALRAQEQGSVVA
jgi:hypothetical protein